MSEGRVSQQRDLRAAPPTESAASPIAAAIRPGLDGPQLMSAITQGDQRAFAELYERYAPRLLGLIAHVLGQRRDAEDVLQEVFKEIWTRADRFDATLGSLEGWLIRLARSRSVDHLRSATSSRRRDDAYHAARNQVLAEGDQAPGDGDPVAELRSGPAGQAMDQLTAEQREALILSYHRGMSASQIAELKSLPLGTVKTRIRSAVLKLRDELSRDGG